MSAIALVSGDSSHLPAQAPRSVTPTDVFVVAHQDDWQLFMGDVAMKAVRRGNQVFFIYLTAGDENRAPDYWITRERAALVSTRLATRTIGDSLTHCENIVVRAHTIRRCPIANTVSFFLRLPDGRRDGGGFEGNAFQSLRKLRTATIAAIQAVDTSARYRRGPDLPETLSELVRREQFPGSQVTLHTSDPNAAINPRDHSDHRETGLIGAAVRRRTGWALIYYVGYALAARPDNRSREQARQKTALFLVYDREMLLANRRWSTYAERPRFYSMCMLRTYARKFPAR